MLHTLYRKITPLLGPFLKPYLLHRVKQGKEDRTRLPERFGKSSITRPEGRVIWLHAASVGESISALPLIERLSISSTVLVTTGTVTSAEMMAKRLPQGAIHQYMPLDNPKWINQFLDHWRPNIALWLESELWPNTLYAIKQRHIPSVLVNARMSARSIRNWKKHPKLALDILSCFDLILAQNQDMANHISALGHTNTDYIGNLKFASTPMTWNEDDLNSLQTMIGDRPVWLMASTHAGEEEIAISTHQKLVEQYPNLLTIIIPRHPKRGDDIQTLIEQASIKCARRSHTQPITADTGIYLADTMGEMGLFYKLSPLLTMAGSFIPDTWGGHNIIEPAHLDCAITYGPIMYNHQDSKQALENANATIGVQNSGDLFETINALLNDEKRVKLMQEQAKETVTGYLGVIDTITTRISTLIEATTS